MVRQACKRQGWVVSVYVFFAGDAVLFVCVRICATILCEWAYRDDVVCTVLCA